MPSPLSAKELLEQNFITMRHRVLDLAAAMDRIQESQGGDALAGDARIIKLHEAIRCLSAKAPDRAVKVQMIFSDPYEPNWQRP